MDPTIFKAYDIRGVYPDQLDEQDAWKIGYATARFLRSMTSGCGKAGANYQSVCVGRDMRTHGEKLSAALIEGINAANVNAIDISLIDSPQMYFAVNYLGTCGGIQVTASHNPAEYNGFKISGLKAVPIGADTGLKDIAHIAIAMLHTKGKMDGSVERYDLGAEYKKHVLKFLHPDIKKMKVAIDASNGMAGKVVPLVFGDAPVEIIGTNMEYSGTFKHAPNPLLEENLQDVKRLVREKNCDFGICFDGDADRLVMVDEKAEVVGCDLLTAILTAYFLSAEPGSTIVYDLRSSQVVSEEIIKHGGTPRRERVGHAYMKKTLRDTHGIFGGELSGHFYYRDNFYADSGLITLAHVLNITGSSDKPVSELVRPLRRYYSSGELNFRVRDKAEKMQQLAKKYSDGNIDYLDGVTVRFKDFWFNCRPSNTEPLLRLNVEAKSQKLLEDKLAEIEKQLGTRV